MVLTSIAVLLFGANVAVQTQSPGPAIRHATLGGMPLCIWNDSSVFSKLKRAIQEADQHLFRFPNGSASNEYHWNGAGTYDTDSVWIASDSSYKPGWRTQTIHRGSTKADASVQGYSRITDGDTSTYWWSNPDHPATPGWFLLDLGKSAPLDSIVLNLLAPLPDSIQILHWTGSPGVYPPPNQQHSGWVIDTVVTAAEWTRLKLSGQNARFVGVRPVAPKGGAWKVAEASLWNAGKQVGVSAPDPTTQTKVIATSAHPASMKETSTSNWDFDTYMAWIAAYPGAIPLITVNYGTGTAEEAASWVRYANLTKKHGIKRWQIGNENSGAWEEGGSVSARQYATRFVKFAKAMKAVDPTIQISGPLTPESDWLKDASGDFDGRPWLEGFLRFVDSAERADGSRYLDGVDVHTYPYYYENTSDRADMLRSCDGKGAAFDSLANLIERTLAGPESREVWNSEYNAMVGIRSSLQQEVSGASSAGLVLAHYIQRFGNRGGAIFWQLTEEGSVGTDGTWGSMGAFTPTKYGAHSTLGQAPVGTFWMLRTLLREWLDTSGTDTILPIDQVAGARLFAVRNQGRTSVLAFNLGNDTVKVAMDPTPFPSGDLMSWGSGEYAWNGTDASAYAFPDNGPSSRRIPSNWDGTVRVPPLGIAIVRGSRSAGKIRTPHLLARTTKLTVEDTLALSGWTIAPGSHLVSGAWEAGSHSGPITTTDSVWDGTSESWVLKIAGSEFGEGAWKLHLAFKNAEGDSIIDTLAFSVMGKPRPVVLISDFNDRHSRTTWDSAWYVYTSEIPDSAKFDTLIDTVGGKGSPYLLVQGHIGQPPALGYKNFVGASFFKVSGPDEVNLQHDLAGIAFDYKSASTGTGASLALFGFRKNMPDWDVHFANLSITKGKWVHKEILFSDFQQAGWGIPAEPLDEFQLTQLEFRMQGAGDFSLGLDNVMYLGTRGQALGTKPNRVNNRMPISIANRSLHVNIEGPWKLRIVDARGRTHLSREGQGPEAIHLDPMPIARWGILEGASIRQSIGLPPILR